MQVSSNQVDNSYVVGSTQKLIVLHFQILKNSLISFLRIFILILFVQLLEKLSVMLGILILKLVKQISLLRLHMTARTSLFKILVQEYLMKIFLLYTVFLVALQRFQMILKQEDSDQVVKLLLLLPNPLPYRIFITVLKVYIPVLEVILIIMDYLLLELLLKYLLMNQMELQ